MRWGAVRAGEGGQGQNAAGLPWPIRRVPGRQPQALSPTSTTCSIFPAGSGNPHGDCQSPPLPGVFPALLLACRPGFPQAFCFPPARSLCKAGSDGKRGGGCQRRHTHIHTQAYKRHLSAAAPGRMPIPFIQARDPLAGGRGMGGVSGDHVGPGSGCRVPGWRRLPPPARRSVRPSSQPPSLRARRDGLAQARRPHGPPAAGRDPASARPAGAARPGAGRSHSPSKRWCPPLVFVSSSVSTPEHGLLIPPLASPWLGLNWRGNTRVLIEISSSGVIYRRSRALRVCPVPPPSATNAQWVSERGMRSTFQDFSWTLPPVRCSSYHLP